MLELYRHGRYWDASETVLQAQSRFPEREGEISYWIACLNCRLGKTGEALKVLLEALEKGHWWGEYWLLHDPDLAPIRPRPEFQRILGG